MTFPKAKINKKKPTNWPLLFFLTNIILMFGRPVDILPFIAIIKPGMLMALGILLYWINSKQRNIDLQENEIKTNIYLIVICVISLYWADNIGATFAIFQNYIMHLFGFTLAAMLTLKNIETFKRFLNVWLGVNMYLAYTVIINGGRGTGGILGDENDVGAAIVMVIPYFYYSTQLFTKRLSKILIYTGLALCLVAVISTGSRGAFLGLLSVLGAIFYLSNHKFKLFFVGTTVLIIAISFFVSDEYISEIISINDTEDDTRTERLYSWGLGLQMFLDHPIFGVGAGQYPWAVCRYQPAEDIAAGMHILCTRVSHSTYVDILADYGLFGVFCFSMIAISIISKLRKCKQFVKTYSKSSNITKDYEDKIQLIDTFTNILIVTLIGFASSGLFISILYYPFIWIPIGIIIAISRYTTNLEEKLSKT